MRKQLAIIWALVVALLLAHNGYLWLGQRITPDTDIMALLPVQQRDPILQRSFTHMVDAAQQRVIVLIGAVDWSDARKAADAYSAILSTQPAVLSASAISDQTQQDWLALFFAHRSVLLAADQKREMAHPDKSTWTDAALRQLYSPFAGPKLGAWRDDPFGLFAAWVQERALETPVRPRDGYLFVSDSERQYVLLSLTITNPVFSISTQESVTHLLNAAHTAAKQAVPDADLITAGVVLHAAAAGQQASGEVLTIGVGSLLGIILLMWATFRSLQPILLILLSISIGFLGSFSVCWLIFGHIHLLTLVFGASLIGVAQDYGLFFLCHRMHAEQTLDSSALLKRLLPSLALTLAAAVIGYMGLAFTPFPGLRNMAIFSALGLVFAWMTVVCWFPTLVSADNLRGGRLANRYSKTLSLWPRWRSNKIGWLVILCLAIGVTTGVSKLTADDDIRLLQNSPPQLVADQIKLSKLLDAPTPVQYFLIRAASEQLLLEQEEKLKLNLDQLILQKKFSGYQAISNWVPSQLTQQANLSAVKDQLFDATLHELAIKIDEGKDWEMATRQHMSDAGQLLTVTQFMASPASEPWRHLWLGKVANGEGQNELYASIVALRGLAQTNVPEIQRAADNIAGVQWVDKVAEISGVLGQYRHYMGWVVIGSYLMVFGLLSLRYRLRSWRVIAPTAVASLIALALLGWTHQPVQLFHVLAFMLLLGIGVDYGIFMHERHARKQQGGAGDAGTIAWLAIGLSAANTLLSFGLLGLSQTPALRAFGLTMLIGIAMVWIIVPFFRNESSYEL